MTTDTVMDPQVVRDAARWLTKRGSSEWTSTDEKNWQNWYDYQPGAQSAWQQAERLRSRFGAVPAAIAIPVLGREDTSQTKRATLKTLAAISITAPMGWYFFRQPLTEWDADYKTAVGEMREVALSDGTHVAMNTATKMDVPFSDKFRRLRLYDGEVLVSTGTDTQTPFRPFVLETRQGVLQDVSTTQISTAQFNVRKKNDKTIVSVLAGALQISLAKSSATQSNQRIVKAGQSCGFTESEFGVVRLIDSTIAMWKQGMLYADNMRLDEFLNELSRYKKGRLDFDVSSLSTIRISGVFQVADPDRVLSLLSRTYSLKIDHVAPYWTSITRY